MADYQSDIAPYRGVRGRLRASRGKRCAERPRRALVRMLNSTSFSNRSRQSFYRDYMGTNQPALEASSVSESTTGTPRSSFSLGSTVSRVQPVVGTLAGLVSVIGAAFSLVELARPTNTGELVAIVQPADARRNVSDVIIEVLTTENAIVA